MPKSAFAPHKLAFALLGLASAVLVFFNSCQGPGMGKGFQSSAAACSMKAGLVKKIDLNRKAKQEILKSLPSVYDHKKVQLGLSSANVQGKATDATLASGTQLAVLIDNECVAAMKSEPNQIALSSSITEGKAAIEELDIQSYDYELTRNWSSSEFEATVERDVCIKGVSYNKTYALASTSMALSDPFVAQQQHFNALKAPEAYAKFYSMVGGMKKAIGPKVIVAVLDTGIDTTHPDLVSNIWQYKVDGQVFWGLDAATLNTGAVNYNPIDDASNGHGTHVSGLIAAMANNSVGGAGLMPYRAEIMAIKVFRLVGYGQNLQLETTTTIVSNAIRWAASHGAQVINLSLTKLEAINPNVPGSGRDAEYEAALQYAINAGAFVVAAAGNSTNAFPAQEINDTTFTSLPARYGKEYAGMMAVGATSIATGNRAYFSQYGKDYVEIAAPGTQNNGTSSAAGIFSTVPTWVGTTGGYSVLEGTSMASPMVAAAAALTIGVIRDAYGLVPNPAEVERLILASADKSSPLEPYFKDGNSLNLKSLIELINKEYPRTRGASDADREAESCI